MILERFKISNYKCLYDSGWITISNPTILIGCNDGGKSSTLEALDLFFNNYTPTENQYSFKIDAMPDSTGERPRMDTMILEAEFKLNEKEIESLRNSTGLSAKELLQFRKSFVRIDSTFKTEVLIEVPVNKDIPADPNSLNPNEIRDLFRKYNIDNPGGREKTPLVEALSAWVKTQPKELCWVKSPSAINNMLPIFQKVEMGDPEGTIHRILNITFKQLMKDEKTVELLTKFNQDFDSLLRNPLIEKTGTLVGYIKNYLPDIVEAKAVPQFEVDPRFESTQLTLVGKDGAPIDLSCRGAGTVQQVNLSVFQWSSETMKAEEEDKEKNIIMVFDEPDLHLDYEAQKRIYEAMEKYREKGVQLIVATHSINLINRVPLECINCYSKPTSELKTKIERFVPTTSDQDEENLFIDRVGQVMGFDNATILYESCFLTFEGATEQSALPILFKIYTNETLIRKGIRLVNCSNDYGAIVFAKFLHKNNRPVVFMVDEDTTWNKGIKRELTIAKIEKANFNIVQQVNFVSPVCFEYAFSNKIWAKVLNDNQPIKGKLWSPEDVEVFRKGDAKVFIDEMFKVLQEESKPRVGRMIAHSVTSVDDIPTSIRNCFNHVLQIVNK